MWRRLSVSALSAVISELWLYLQLLRKAAPCGWRRPAHTDMKQPLWKKQKDVCVSVPCPGGGTDTARMATVEQLALSFITVLQKLSDRTTEAVSVFMQSYWWPQIFIFLEEEFLWSSTSTRVIRSSAIWLWSIKQRFYLMMDDEESELFKFILRRMGKSEPVNVHNTPFKSCWEKNTHFPPRSPQLSP